jgi:hypothetical protein
LTADFGDERFDVACLWDTVEKTTAFGDGHAGEKIVRLLESAARQ